MNPTTASNLFSLTPGFAHYKHGLSGVQLSAIKSSMQMGTIYYQLRHLMDTTTVF